jgi:hypothetical protein
MSNEVSPVNRVSVKSDCRHRERRCVLCELDLLEDEVASVLAQLERDNWLTSVPREQFVERLGYYYGELNARGTLFVKETEELSVPSFVS